MQVLDIMSHDKNQKRHPRRSSSSSSSSSSKSLETDEDENEDDDEEERNSRDQPSEPPISDRARRRISAAARAGSESGARAQLDATTKLM
ncbi:MAG: hypothetical protein DME24_14250 [Verrucomicrobia bacterium]|nr:MAG: hypothetical protein DME24_14250 [Verrucomicrobiota bacterium]